MTAPPACDDGHVLFVANQRRTHFYAALALRLRARGIRVSWIATSPRWADVARDESRAGDDDILLLAQAPMRSRQAAPSDADRALLAAVEGRGLSIKAMILADRELKRRPWPVALAHLAALATQADAFLRGRGVDLCFGEATWSHELLLAQLAPLHGATYAQPVTIRVPSERFGLIDHGPTDRLFRWQEAGDAHRAEAGEIVAALAATAAKPYYMATPPSPFRWRAHWWDELRAALRPGATGRDHTVPALRVRGARRVGAAWYGLHARAAPFHRGPSQPDMPFVLVTLHVQPEASIDVLGAPFDNQIENVRALSRVLPVDHEILVKEHPNGLGDRSPAFHRTLARIPGVRLIHPAADTAALIRRARLVLSPTGTSCYEAALLGVPAVCFAPVFFEAALTRARFNPYGIDRAGMAAFLIDSVEEQRRGTCAQRAQDFLAEAIANSFPGRYGDAVDPETMRPDNLDLCAAGLAAALGHLRRRAAA